MKEINGIGTVYARMDGYDSTVMAWVASPPFSASGGGPGGSTQVSVSGLTFTSSGELVVAATINAAAGSTTVNVSSLAGIVTIAGNSTVVQGTSPWVVGFPAGYLSSGVPAGNSSGLTVRPVWSSSGVDQPVRAVLSSTSADNPVSISGNSTVVQGTNPWVVGFPAGYLSSAVPAGNSSGVLVRPVWSSTAADQTVRAVFSSTNTDNPVRAILSSTSADNPVVATIGTNLQSSVAGSSASSGLLVRNIIDAVLTTASTSAMAASTAFSIQSSAASIRSYVVAYSIMTTNAGPTTLKFMSGSTLVWPMQFAAVSSAISGANLAVSAPSYLFRTKTAGPLSLNTNGSTIAGWKVGVSYFRAP